MNLIDPKVCRCGVYKHLHPTRTCTKIRRSYWWNRHYLWRHIAAQIWWHTPEKTRWTIAHHMQSPKRDWCGLVDSVIHAGLDYRDDYQGEWGCGCDADLPVDVGPPRLGWCYCPATEEQHAAAWAEIHGGQS